MPRNSFVQMSKLHNVRGRIYYISSDKKQENLYAVYETTDRKFWTELAKCNQAEFKKSGTEGKCIEAREFIIALPESFVDYAHGIVAETHDTIRKIQITPEDGKSQWEISFFHLIFYHT